MIRDLGAALEEGHYLIWLVGLLAALLTATYIFRVVFLVFFGSSRMSHEVEHHVHESPPVMTLPLWILMGGSIVAGLLWIPHLFLPFEHWLEPVIHGHAEEHVSEALEWGLMATSVSDSAAGFFIAYLMYYRSVLAPERFANLAGGFFYRLFDRKYYLDEIYQVIFVNGTLLLARFGAAFDQYIIDGIVDGSAALTRFVSWLDGLFDQYIIDGIVNAIANIIFWAGNRLRRVQTGNINSYLYGILIAIVLAIIVKLRYWS